MGSKRRVWIAWILVSVASLLCFCSYFTLPSLGIDDIAASQKEFEGEDGVNVDGRGTARQKDGRVAICLVGGVREFELTGPSIQKHLLNAYPRTDVFLHAPLDETTHKLNLLYTTPNLVAVRIFSVSSVNESAYPLSILRVRDSPFGVQGLLHYFRLVEGCLPLIGAHERRHRVHYSWILRTRVDGFWSGPPPPLASLDPSKYTIPYGSDWGGYNDRFGVGGRAASQVALSRLSMLADLQRMNLSDLNSERSFQAQLARAHVAAVRTNVPFCVLSRHRYPWVEEHGLPVAALTSTAPLNGAKCRPCNPRARGQEAAQLIRSYAGPEQDKWIGPSVEGVDLCDAQGPFEAGWQAIFDRAAGPQLASVRRHVAAQTEEGCAEDMAKIQRHVEVWDAPPPTVVCGRRRLGRARVVGSGEQQWAVFLGRLQGTAVMYSIRPLTGQGSTLDQLLRKMRPRMEMLLLETGAGEEGAPDMEVGARPQTAAAAGTGGVLAGAQAEGPPGGPAPRYRPRRMVLRNRRAVTVAWTPERVWRRRAGGTGARGRGGMRGHGEGGAGRGRSARGKGVRPGVRKPRGMQQAGAEGAVEGPGRERLRRGAGGGALGLAQTRRGARGRAVLEATGGEPRDGEPARSELGRDAGTRSGTRTGTRTATGNSVPHDGASLQWGDSSASRDSLLQGRWRLQGGPLSGKAAQPGGEAGAGGQGHGGEGEEPSRSPRPLRHGQLAGGRSTGEGLPAVAAGSPRWESQLTELNGQAAKEGANGSARGESAVRGDEVESGRSAMVHSQQWQRGRRRRLQSAEQQRGGREASRGGAWTAGELRAHIGTRRVELLKVYDIGFEDAHIRAWLLDANLRVCQLLIAFASRGEGARQRRDESFKVLTDLGFHLNSCGRVKHYHSEKCLFFSLQHCSA